MITLFRKLLATAILFAVHLLPATAQTEEDFQKKYAEVYSEKDKKKATAIAKEAYKMLEKKKELQTYANYYILKTIFEKQAPDAALAKTCTDKADRLMREQVGIETKTDHDYGSDSMNLWHKTISTGLYENTDPDIPAKAVAFLNQYTSFQTFTNYTSIANAFERRGDYKNAKKYFEQSLKLVNKTTDEYYSYYYYALFLLKSGDYLAAEDMIKKIDYAANTATGYFKTAYTNEANSARTLFFYYTGDFQSFLQSSEKQYAALDAMFKENKLPCIGQSYIHLLNAAASSEYTKNYDAAERLWKTRDSVYSNWLQCQRDLYPNLKLYDYSMAPVFLLKRGKENKLQKPLNYYVKEATTYYNSFSKYADASNNYFFAERLAFLKAKEYKEMFPPLIQRIRVTKDFSQSTLPLSSYAYFTMRDGLLDESKKTYKELFDINTGWINDIIFSLGERAFVSYYNSKLKDGYDNFHSFVKLMKDKNNSSFPELAGQAYNNLLFTKSISLQGTKKRKEAFLKTNQPATIKLYETWLDKKQQLIREYLKSSGPDNDPKKNDTTAAFIYIKKLQEEVTRMEGELAAKATDFKKLLKIIPPNWKEVQDNLKEGEAAIEIIRFDWRNQVYYSDTAYYAAYIITKKSMVPDIIYLPAKPTDLEIKHYTTYKNNIRYKTDDKESYNHFWKPIAENLKGISKVYLSPDGIYHLVNIPTLKNPSTGKFVIDEIDIQPTTSTADISFVENKKTNSTAVLFGRPSYRTTAKNGSGALTSGETRSFVTGFKDENIPDLPGTETEVVGIKTELEKNKFKVNLYLKDDATEEKLYKLQSPSILHIATHGYWAGTTNASDGFRAFNAMANSGLLLSGVINYYNTTPYPNSYDGVLTAYEAQNLDLTNTSLVILSACETTLGFLDAGEGVYGLQRAFKVAGAGSIITSLWKVDDIATKDFMILFYQQYFKTKDKSAAFIAAQKGIKEKYIHPYYWGAFVMMGK